MSRFFIDRPVFAWVLAIVMMMVGGIAVFTLPQAQYPPIAPPAISITVVYPGASAETVQSTVVQVIEQQLSGIDHLLYFSSESDKDGSVTITLSFEQGTDPDIAQVQVQNKVQLAHARRRRYRRYPASPRWADVDSWRSRHRPWRRSGA